MNPVFINFKHECVDADFDMWMINFLFNFTLIL